MDIVLTTPTASSVAPILIHLKALSYLPMMIRMRSRVLKPTPGKVPTCIMLTPPEASDLSGYQVNKLAIYDPAGSVLSVWLRTEVRKV